MYIVRWLKDYSLYTANIKVVITIFLSVSVPDSFLHAQGNANHHYRVKKQFPPDQFVQGSWRVFFLPSFGYRADGTGRIWGW